jgi:hypothetical protein
MADLTTALQTICLNRKYINYILQTYYQAIKYNSKSTFFCFQFYYGSPLGYGGPDVQLYTGADIINKFVNGNYNPASPADLAYLQITQYREFYGKFFEAILLAKEFFSSGKYYCYYITLPPGLFPGVITRSTLLKQQDLLNFWPYFAI